MIYLDNAATTHLSPIVLERLTEVYKLYSGNNSSPHISGKRANDQLKTARATIASLLGLNEGQFYFTSGATESINVILQGYARHLKRIGEQHRNEVIVASFEHPAVYNTVMSLKELGFTVHEVMPSRAGLIDVSALESLVTEKTAIVAIMHVNNETGATQSINELARYVKSISRDILFFTDTVQAIGKIPYKYDYSCVDALVMSGHKFGGPKGIGGFYLNPEFRIKPILFGGNQEMSYRPGTVNVPGATLMAIALEEAMTNIENSLRHTEDLNQLMYTEFENLNIEFERVISEELSSPYIASIIIHNKRSETLIEQLSENGICVSSKSACSSTSHKKSRILESMGMPLDKIDNVLRISFSPTTSKEDVVQFVKVLSTLTQ